MLDKSGAKLNYYTNTEHLQELNKKLPPEKKFVSSLPSIFQEFACDENKYHPSIELRKLSIPNQNDIKNELEIQCEKQMFQDSLMYTFDCVFDITDDQKLINDEIQKAKSQNLLGFPQLQLKSSKDDTLGFESRFESGNLASANKVNDYEYDLYLSPDHKSKKQTSWFFFRVFNTKKNKIYRLNICNFSNNETIYNEKTRLLCFSEKLNRFCYLSSTCFACMNNSKKKNYKNFSTLSITLTFPEDNDSVFLMNSFPYTYSRLNSFLTTILENDIFFKYLRVFSFTKTLLGFECPMLVIDDPIYSSANRKNIAICARQHPGEPLGSLVCERLILSIISDTKLGKELRSKYVFYFSPMLNIDGVVLGNHRFDLSCIDLNRNWKEPTTELCPTIFAFKAFFKSMVEDGKDIFIFIDLHAHSKKYNCFFYANPIKDKTDHIIVALMQKYCSLYSINDTTYRIRKEKENSARVVVWKDLGVRLSYTLEVGYGGISIGNLKDEHHSSISVEEIAQGLAQSFVEMYDFESCKEKIFFEGKFEIGGNSDLENGKEIFTKIFVKQPTQG